MHIEVLDVNEFRPSFEFDFYRAKALESDKVGSSVLNVTANDNDAGIKGRLK